MTVRAAIIGLGRWGRSLVNAVHGKTDAITFTAAYTRTRANAEQYCREKNIPLLDRFEDALADPDIDAVVLATPHSRHAEQVMAAAAAGKRSGAGLVGAARTAAAAPYASLQPVNPGRNDKACRPRSGEHLRAATNDANRLQ